MDNAFFAVCKNIDRMETEWRQTKTGTSPTASVVNLWKEGQRMHDFLRSYKREIAEEYNQIIVRFAGSYRVKQEQEYRDRLSFANEKVVEGYREDVRRFIADKTEKLDAMLTTPPTAEQRALLDSLKLRGRNLTKAEALRILPVFYGNYEALKAFQNICGEAGYKLFLPMEDAIDLYQILERFEEYMMRVAGQIGSENSDMDMSAGSFFYEPADDPTYIEPAIAQFSNAFDSVPQLQNYDTVKLTASEQARLDTLFHGIEKLDPDKISDLIKLSARVQQIAKDHREDVPLILRSRYGKLLQMAVDLDKAKLEAIAENQPKENEKLHGNTEPLRQ